MILAALVLIWTAPLASAVPAQEENDWTVWAERVHTASGNTLEGALVQVTDGVISAVTPMAKPPRQVALRAAALTPGMLDASIRLTPGSSAVEQSREQVADQSMVDAIDPLDLRWIAQARRGVTAGVVCPPDFAVIGGMGAVLKTAGPLDGRVVAEDVCLRGSMGEQPSSGNNMGFGVPSNFYVRRPTTRMGVEWVWRKSLYEAYYSRGDSDRAFDGSDVLNQALDGGIPVSIQAWTTQDIRTAVFLKEEMAREGLGELELIVDAAAEAWREPDLLVRVGAAVVLPPFTASGRTTEGALLPLECPKELHDLGIPIALSAHGDSSTSGNLARQAGLAMRGGLSFDAALEAVTIAPARMYGVDDRLGSIEVGKDADLVLWNGPPFESTSRVVGVLVQGELIVDPRPAADQQDQ